MSRDVLRHRQVAVHGVTPNTGNRRFLKNTWQRWNADINPVPVPTAQEVIHDGEEVTHDGEEVVHSGP